MVDDPQLIPHRDIELLDFFLVQNHQQFQVYILLVEIFKSFDVQPKILKLFFQILNTAFDLFVLES